MAYPSDTKIYLEKILRNLKTFVSGKKTVLTRYIPFLRNNRPDTEELTPELSVISRLRYYN